MSALDQAAIDAAMTRLGCNERHQRPRAGGGVYCATHMEFWWFEGGARGCRVAWREAKQ